MYLDRQAIVASFRGLESWVKEKYGQWKENGWKDGNGAKIKIWKL